MVIKQVLAYRAAAAPGTVLVDGHTFALPHRSILLSLTGFLSVTRDPGVCDEKGQKLIAGLRDMRQGTHNRSIRRL
jgi:hypothetical protein